MFLPFVLTYVREDIKVNKILMHVSHNNLNKQLCQIHYFYIVSIYVEHNVLVCFIKN